MLVRLCTLLALIGVTASVSNVSPAMPRVVSERIVNLPWASDVRWADADHVLVTDVGRGIARLSIWNGEDPSWLPEWAAPHGPGTVYHHLATSETAILTADYAFSFQWRERNKPKLHEQSFYYITDIDLDGERLLILGCRMGPDGKVGSEGGVAWIGSLHGGDGSLRPILPYRNFDAFYGCFGFGVGVVRFLSNGSFIVVPGVEPGIYLFAKNGKLQHVWQTDVLGLEDMKCTFSPQQRLPLWNNPVARQEWLNKYRMVDDVVETPSGPALITRKFTTDAVHWNAVLLNADGSTFEQPLPLSSPSPYAHVAAASRGDRIAVVIGNRDVARNPKSTSRLVILEWPKP
jgi:hypothetical protein